MLSRAGRLIVFFDPSRPRDTTHLHPACSTITMIQIILDLQCARSSSHGAIRGSPPPPQPYPRGQWPTSKQTSSQWVLVVLRNHTAQWARMWTLYYKFWSIFCKQTDASVKAIMVLFCTWRGLTVGCSTVCESQTAKRRKCPKFPQNNAGKSKQSLPVFP